MHIILRFFGRSGSHFMFFSFFHVENDFNEDIYNSFTHSHTACGYFCKLTSLQDNNIPNDDGQKTRSSHVQLMAVAVQSLTTIPPIIMIVFEALIRPPILIKFFLLIDHIEHNKFHNPCEAVRN